MADLLEEFVPTVKRLPTQETSTVEEIFSTAPRIYEPSDYYDTQRVRQFNLLRNCRFAFRMDRIPDLLGVDANTQRDFTFLSDSIEMPGKVIATVENRIPGLQKIKTPYLRDFNEITVSFYHNTGQSIYDIFSSWLEIASPSAAENEYFDNLTGEATIIQFSDVATSGMKRMQKQYEVILRNIIPINLSSIPVNWADDGFQKINVTLFYESYQVTDKSASTEIVDYLITGRAALGRI